MQTVIIQPRKRRNELLFVAISTVSILVFASMAIYFRAQPSNSIKLKPHQLSAFSQLNTVEQSIFSELYTSAVEIELYHTENNEQWPKIRDLNKLLISPFTKNVAWKARGRIKWVVKAISNDNVHRVAYIGTTSNSKITGSFILILEHFHTMDGAYFYGVNKLEPFSIWYKNGAVSVPKRITESMLRAANWKEAIAYRGKSQLRSYGKIK